MQLFHLNLHFYVNFKFCSPDFPEIQNVEDPHDMNKLSNYLLRGRRWKEGKPLWEVLLLRNKGVKSLVIFRIHHVIGDGHSILNMWDKVFTTKDARPVLQGAPVQQKRDESSLDKICSVILAPYHLVKLFRSLSMNRDKLPCSKFFINSFQRDMYVASKLNIFLKFNEPPNHKLGHTKSKDLKNQFSIFLILVSLLKMVFNISYFGNAS